MTQQSTAEAPARPVSPVVDEARFAALTDPLRGELTAHCYRMLGSFADAEDQVQETYLRAWRAFPGFEGRSTVRSWLYRIATNTCLTALEQRGRRPMPTGLGAPASDPEGELDSRPEVPWLQPLPDAAVSTASSDPATAALAREGVRLAFVAALQHLTPRQRAVVVLRDVLAFSAEETAQTLGTTVASANSALQRARATLARTGAGEPTAPRELTAREEALVEAYVRAFEEYDTPAVVALLREDATWEMPPFAGWYRGAAEIGRLIDANCPASAAGDLRMLVVGVNGQPACATYLRGPDGVHRAFQLQVLDLDPGEADGAPPRVRHVAAFFDTSVFRAAGLPERLDPLDAGPSDDL